MYTECDQWPWHNWRCETGSFGVWSSITALLVTDNYSITRSQNSVYTRRHFWTIKRIAYSSSRMRVMNYNWSATKHRLHLQSVAEISRHSVLSGDRIQHMWDIVWVSPQEHRSVSVSRYFLLQALQCPCFARKRFSRDYCCQRRSRTSINCCNNNRNPFNKKTL